MSNLELKSTHKPVQNYYAALRQFDDVGVRHEGAVKSAFFSLSASTGERARVRCRSDARAFADFAELARCSINPNLADAAFEEMLIKLDGVLLPRSLQRKRRNTPLEKEVFPADGWICSLAA